MAKLVKECNPWFSWAPPFYQRLIHMSEDKVKFRNTGPVHCHVLEEEQ
jgi:hypothetical protein